MKSVNLIPSSETVSRIVTAFCFTVTISHSFGKAHAQQSAEPLGSERVTSSHPSYRTLRRAQFRLTGTPYRAFLSEADSLTNESYSSAVEQLFLHPRYADKMTSYVEDLFRLKQSSAQYGSPNSSWNQLIKKVFQDDRSWNELLLANEYSFDVSNLNPRLSSTDSGFLIEVLENELKLWQKQNKQRFNNSNRSSPNSQYAHFKTESPQIAGALTTNRFFSRYTTNVANRNFGRAAAVFRIFLCDEMTAVALADAKENNLALDLAIGSSQGAKIAQPVKSSKAERHASDPSCRGCHDKLDPVAKFFTGSADRLSSAPVESELVLQTAQGGLIRVPARGLRGLGEALTQRPEFARCQVRHFWNWMIGSDVQLSEQRLNELVRVFEKGQRRPKHLLKHLITSQEFLNIERPQSGSIILGGQVQPILQKCDQCHRSEPLAPRLDKTEGLTEKTIFAVADSLNLDGQNSTKEMPPKDSKWKLEPKEKALLVGWLVHGAKTETGTSVLSRDALPILQRKLEPHLTILSHLKLNKPTFDWTAFRYVQNFDFIAVLNELKGYRVMNEDVAQFGLRSGPFQTSPMFRRSLTGKPQSSRLNSAVLEAYLKASDSLVRSRHSYYGSTLSEISKQLKLAIDWPNDQQPLSTHHDKTVSNIIEAIIEWSVGLKTFDSDQTNKLRTHLGLTAATFIQTRPTASLKSLTDVLVQAALISDLNLIE